MSDTKQSAAPSTDRLDSWKEIAAYLNRGTRTVQRWEAEERLPVHRLQHDKLGSVYAYKNELDAWRASRSPEADGRAMESESGLSVAVLPFDDMSRDKDQGYFCEGTAEELILALSKIRGLQVASRLSSFRYRETGMEIRDIGRKLRVSTLLGGSVRRSGERVRIAVQLTDADTGYQLWSETYDCEMSDVFAIQEGIARSVAQTLEVKLTPHETAALKKPPAKDVQAHDLYLRGRQFYFRFGKQDMECAIQLFTRAVERQPDYALAYAGLADCWSYVYLYCERSEMVRDQALWASRKAVELDAECAQAQASRGLALSLGGDDGGAQRAFEAAILLDPRLFEAYYFHARHCFARGRLEEAAERFEKAMEVRPEDYQAPLLAAQVYEALGRTGDAKTTRLRGLSLAEEHLKLNPDDARAVYMAANGMAALGQHERARSWANRALAMRPDDPMLLYNIGCIYSLLGCTDDAIATLEKAAASGLTERGWYEQDGDLRPLRNDPRFRKIVDTLPR